MNFSGFDSYIENAMESWHCPGVAISVIKEDEIVYQRVLGFRNTEDQLPLTEDTRFPLASVTKSFTAMSAALLVDEERLEWDKPVCHYMPEFILEDPYVTRHVTLRDMLSHRTGMPRHDYAGWRLELPREEFIKRMRHLKFSTSLREKYQYNNLMYAAASYLVEKIAGQRWEDFVQERIFAPLGMVASNFGPSLGVSEHPLAEGYRVERTEEGKFKQLVQMPFGKHTELSPGAAGALFSTLSDMTHWLKTHISDGRSGEVQLVSRTNLKQMHMPQMVMPVNEMGYALSGLTMQAYGMGWMIRPYPFSPGTLIFHDGNVEGHSSHIGFIPESKIGVIVLANAAALCIPTVLAREAMDRALGLKGKDWNAKFHAVIDPVLVAMGRGKKTSADEKLEQSPPSHALEAYEGTYSADGYPDFGVRLENGELQACTLGSLPWSELRHYHYDVFEWYISIWDTRIKTKFITEDTGEVGAISIPMTLDVPDIVFVRKPIAIDASTLSAIVGEYDPQINGLMFHVSQKNGKLYWSESGQSAVEAKPRRSSPSEVEFSVNRSRVQFSKVDDKWDRIVLKTPSATFEAHRLK